MLHAIDYEPTTMSLRLAWSLAILLAISKGRLWLSFNWIIDVSSKSSLLESVTSMRHSLGHLGISWWIDWHSITVDMMMLVIKSIIVWIDVV